jgi:thiol-disulfide isomerase/thioredoxin
MSRPAALVTALVIAALSGAAIHAQQPIAAPATGQPAGVLPADPGAWVNSSPITSQMLAGKAALLYFYEEGCPRCRERWPTLMEAAKQFEGKPIVFIAVNSGNPRTAVEQYARQVNLSWPVIVDGDRKLEAAAQVGQISLQNIYQVALIMPDGKITQGRWDDIPGSANRALQGAAWRIDPTGIDPSLKPAWQAMEIGNFAAAGAILKKARSSAKPEIKESVAKLDAAAAKEMEALAAKGKAAVDSGDKWGAFKAYSQLTETYAGFTLPAGAEEAKKSLASDPAVKAALTAATQLASAKKQLATGSSLARKRVLAVLEKIIKDAPESEAGQEAKTMLEQLRG